MTHDVNHLDADERPPETPPSPWLQPWPEEELERVSACPVCGGDSRTILHENLVDNVFFVAEGRWTLYQCMACRSAYLDPRPSRASIGRAYGGYYTHQIGGGSMETSQLGVRSLLRRMLANGYRNHRYGVQRRPALSLGVWVARLAPSYRQLVDIGFRHLPKGRAGRRLLDVGCGNGDFLVMAREAGWRTWGVEPDSQAAAVARQRGFDVKVATLEEFEGEKGSFDAITISHVLEHMPDPSLCLRKAFELLRPGGFLYIDMPNIDSLWHEYYGRAWLGLDPPRHLTLFNWKSAMTAVARCGYVNIAPQPLRVAFSYLGGVNAPVAAGHESLGESLGARKKWRLRKSSLPYRLRACFTFSRSEFVTLTCNKPFGVK